MSTASLPNLLRNVKGPYANHEVIANALLLWSEAAPQTVNQL